MTTTPPLTPADVRLWQALTRKGLGALPASASHATDAEHRQLKHERLALVRQAMSEVQPRVIAGDAELDKYGLSVQFNVRKYRIFHKFGIMRTEVDWFNDFLAAMMLHEVAREQGKKKEEEKKDWRKALEEARKEVERDEMAGGKGKGVGSTEKGEKVREALGELEKEFVGK